MPSLRGKKESERLPKGPSITCWIGGPSGGDLSFGAKDEGEPLACSRYSPAFPGSRIRIFAGRKAPFSVYSRWSNDLR